MFGISAFSQVPFSSLASQVLLASAQITGAGDVTASAYAVRTNSAIITGNAQVESISNAIRTDSASVNGVGSVNSEATRVRLDSAQINGLASVISNATRLRTSSGEVTGFASFSGNGHRIFFVIGTITGSAATESNAIRVRTSKGAVNGFAEVTGLGGVEYSGNAKVNGDAYVASYPNAIWSGYGFVSGIASVTANGSPIGKNWTPVPVDTNTWSNVNVGTNTWTDVSVGTNIWNRQGQVMAKNKISEWSSTPANNTDVGGIDISEGCAPSGINNAIREMMAQVKDMITGADGDNLSVGGNLTVTGTASGTTPAPEDNSTNFATTAYVQTKVGTLGTMASQNSDNVSITGGTLSNVTVSGTNVGTNASGNRTVSTSTPTGGSDGDIWYQY